MMDEQGPAEVSVEDPDELDCAPPGAKLVVYPIRFPADRVEQLRRVAESRDVKPTVLVRDFTLMMLDVVDRKGAETR